MSDADFETVLLLFDDVPVEFCREVFLRHKGNAVETIDDLFLLRKTVSNNSDAS